MSQPDQEHKVVYRAVADFAQLLREAREARTEMRQLKADVESIGGTQQVKVKVQADSTSARAEIIRVFGAIVAKVRVTVDTAAARAEIARVFGAITARVRIDLDVTAARQRVRSGLSNLVALVKVDLTTAPAVTRMRALITRLQAMGPVVLRVTLDNRIFRDTTDLIERLQRLRAELGEGGGGGGGGSPGPRGGGGTDSREAASAAKTGLGAALKIPALIAAAVTAIPILAAVTAAVAGLAAAAVAGGLALGALAVGVVGHMVRVKTAMEEAAKTGAPLTGALGETAAAVDEVKETYNDFLGATQKPVLGLFVQALKIVSALLPRLVSLANLAAEAVAGAMTDVQAGLSGDAFAEFLAFLERAGPAAIRGFVTALLNIAAGIGSLVVAFEPFMHFFLDGLTSMTAGFQAWSDSLGGSPEFEAFMDYVMRVGPKVMDLLGALGGTFINLLAGLAPLGEVLLDVVLALARLTASVDPAVILSLASAFVVAYTALKLWAVAVTLAGRLGMTGLVAGIAGLAGGLRTLPTLFAIAIGSLRTWMATLTLAQAATGIGLIIALIAGAAALATYAVNTRQATRDTKEYKQATQDLADALTASGGKITAEVREKTVAKLKTTEVEETVLLGSNKTSTVLAEADKAGVALDKLSEGAEGNRKSYDEALGAWDKYIAGLKAQRAAADQKMDSKGSARLGYDIALAEKARAAYVGMAPAMADVVAAQQREARARGNLNDLQATGTATAEQLAAAELELADAMTQGSKAYTERMAAIDAALTAREAVATAAEQVTRAEEAEAAAAEQVTAAQEAETEAKARLTDAIAAEVDARENEGKVAEQVAEANADAVKAQIDAEEALADAQDGARKAQEALTKARETARERLQDLARELRDLPLDEEDATRALQQAEEALTAGRNAPGTDAFALRGLEIDVQRKRNALADTLDEGADTRRNAGRELRKGVEGSDEVTDAKKGIADANERAVDAADKLAKAQRNVARTAANGIEAISNSRKATDRAREATDKARVAVGRATTAVGRAATAYDKARVATNKARDAAAKAQLAFERAAAAGDLTAAAIGRIADAQNKIDTKLTIELGEIGGDDVEKRLAAIARYAEAMRLIKLDPTLSVAAALDQAGANIAAAAAKGKPYQRMLPQDLPPAPTNFNFPAPGKAAGGPIWGPGTGTSDSVPLWGSAGEHMWTALEVVMAGGHAAVEQLRKAVRSGGFLGRLQGLAAGGPVQYAGNAAGVGGGYGGLSMGMSRLALAAPAPAALPRLAGGGPIGAARSTSSTVIKRGVTLAGDINVLYAQPEPAGESVYRAVRRLAFEYDD